MKIFKSIIRIIYTSSLIIMEKQINKKLDAFQRDFKDKIKDWISTNSAKICTPHDNDVTSTFLQYVYDSGNIEITSSDLKKRKRIKNNVPHYDLCIAKRANGDQCTRRKKVIADTSTDEDNMYCGTHIKGTPHGIVTNEIKLQNPHTKVEIWVTDIKGICYYIDDNNNVYNHSDIQSNKLKPGIIAKWSKNEKGEYIIPQFEN